MHWLWLAIAVVTGAPVAYASLLLNPLVFVALGSERWREQMLRARPYRRWLGFSAALCVFAAVMFALS